MKMLHNVGVLLWKNLLIRKCHIIAAVAEILVPISVALLINIYLPKLDKAVDNGEIDFAAFQVGKCGSGHYYEDIIIYEPDTSFTNELMAHAACYAGYKHKAVRAGSLSNNNTKFSIGVKFENVSGQSGSASSADSNGLTYTLYPTHPVWLHMHVAWRHTGVLIPHYGVPIIRDVTELQRAIDASYLYLNKIPTPKVELQNTDLFDRDPKILTFIVAITFFFAFTLMIPNVIARIVDEKNSGAKELMIMMGVTRLELWITKFIDAFFFALLSISGVIIFLYVPLTSNSNVLHVSPVLLWCVCMYGVIGLILYFFFLSCFFTKASFAVFITEMIATFLLIIHNFISSVVTFPVLVKYLLSFFPQVTLMNGITVLMDFDFYEKEVRLSEKLSAREDYSSLSEVLTFMTINILLFLVLTWYAEQVIHSKYGVPQPYGFFLKKEYWSPKKVEISENGVSLNNLNQEGFEFVPTDLKPGVTLTNVTKRYKSTGKEPVVAVDNVTLNFYFTEITALLGHNGAGKTTVFSLITGLTYPTSGKVYINGYDLSRNIKQARRDLGMCPQQDMLFGELTATQNILFFGMIKGMKLSQASSEAKQLLEKLNLTAVKDTKSCKLSGGQKRKVSLAIALIGGSKILVLDEPSSGLDPEIRREIWELLLALRGDRTILLTTHFMEEAEALSDRIAIMDAGKVKCFGSSLFLKSKYGQGYILSVVLKDTDNLQRLTDFIRGFTSGAKFKSQNIRTVKYEIPVDEVSNFPKLLEGLDGAQQNNEIVSYSISFATLEDVFLRLRLKNISEEVLDIVDAPPYKKLDERLIDTAEKGMSSYILVLYQFWALLIKKYIYFTRTIFMFLIYCLLPISLILFLGLLENKVRKSLEAAPELNKRRQISYSLNLYSPSTILYSANDQSRGEAFAKFVRGLNNTAEMVSDINEEITKIFQSDFYKYSKLVNLGIEFLSNKTRAFYNEEAVHIIPIALNLLHNFGFRMNNMNNTIVTAVDTSYASKIEIPQFAQNLQCQFLKISEFTSLQVFYYLRGAVREYISGSKHIQLMMTSAFSYWLSHLLFDAVTFTFYLMPIYSYFKYNDETTFLTTYAGEIFLALVLWGVGLIIVTYIVQKIVRHEAGGLVVMVILYIFFSFIVNNPFIGSHLPEFFPYLHPNSLLEIYLKSICDGQPKKKFLLWLFIYNVTVFLLLILMESSFWKEICHRCLSFRARFDYDDEENVEDELVLKEKKEVDNIIDKNKISEYPLVVKDLKRWYLSSFKAKPVVRGISFHVTEGECFGLLGVNGAGKTTTFKMLTADIPPSSGKLYVDSAELHSCRKKKNLFQVSYCPQQDGLISVFKGRELLMLIGRLRGLRGHSLNFEVENLLQKLDLDDLSYKTCGTYSGGNKRKLSTAMAIIGDTRLIFLDEPTTGVDPVSRRLTWNLIDQTQKKGRSFILTSHSMDECEALCSRLAIMVNGNFRCIGELATLKEKFGEGYIVQLKISIGASPKSIQAIKKAMFNNFEPGILLVDDHKTLLQYKITNPSISWAELFDSLNTLKNTYEDVESYGASSTTLEQIFISFARQQK